MNRDGEEVAIESRDYWFKIVEFLQQNWALIDEAADGARVWFLGDTSSVFDRIDFRDGEEAEDALVRNGFRRVAEDAHAQTIISPPEPPFHERPHPNGPIYSSGRHWRAG